MPTVFHAKCLPVAIAGFLLMGCTGYQKRFNGDWVYVTWDEGRGRLAHDINADNETFEVLRDNYARDEDHVFLGGGIIAGADPKTFQLFPDTTFAKDREHAFVRGHVIPSADPQSFTVIEGPYGKDQSRVYCGTNPMEVSDVDKFEVVHWSGMWQTSLSDGADSVAGYAWARDGVSYFHGPKRIDTADYNSFEVLDGFSARDKNNKYSGLLSGN